MKQLAIALIIAVVTSGGALRADPPLRIGRITIQAQPVFDAAEVTRGGFYRALNLLHVQTPAALVKRFLLFREGDPYDPATLAETERNLRHLDFLKSASVTASPPHDGAVDVKVTTEDEWTTDINGDFSNSGGIATYAFDVTQKDLFGTGSELELHGDHGTERNTSAIEFLHPALFGPYWNLDTLYSKNSDGNEEKLALDRPLFSYTTPWAASFLFDHLLRNERIFEQGEIAARFRQEHRELGLSRLRVLHADPNGSSGFAGGIDLLDDSFSHVEGRPLDLIPADRHFRFLDAGYESTGYRFVKLDYVDRDLLEQDFNLGGFTSVHAAVSPRSSGNAPLTWRLRASRGMGYAFSDHAFVIGQISASTRGPHDRNSIVSLDVRSVTRFQTSYPQAFVTRARLDLGWQLDRDVQFLADGQNGLRAYPDFAFEGSRRLILNAEHRLFLGRELLQLFGPSIAVFADSGQAVDGPFRGMKSDAGAGLRIGIARYDSALIRIDWSYAFNASPLSRRGGVWSISTSQAF
ncbi:MAG TPA: hypothetical protein VNN08_04470 [Thermoanaerobaculia bacterium]|nr:hypothetical protein [Thermoanaerobaculia bacterium]